jgi:hypothetical protein
MFSTEPLPIGRCTVANDMGFTLEQLPAHPGTIVFAVNQTGTAEDFQLIRRRSTGEAVREEVCRAFDRPRRWP